MSEREAPPVPPQGAPLLWVRGLALASLVGLAALLLSGLWQRVVVPSEASPWTAEGQQLVVTARRTTQLRVVVDGEVAMDGTLQGGGERTFHGRHIAVDVSAIDHVRLRRNGERIVPQGLRMCHGG